MQAWRSKVSDSAPEDHLATGRRALRKGIFSTSIFLNEMRPHVALLYGPTLSVFLFLEMVELFTECRPMKLRLRRSPFRRDEHLEVDPHERDPREPDPAGGRDPAVSLFRAAGTIPTHPLLAISRGSAFMTALRTATDAELLERCLELDESAWEELVFRYQGLVYSTALEVGLQAEDAGDVFQDVWTEFFRSIRRIRSPHGLPRWLMVATRRLSWKVAVRNRRMISEIPPDLVDPWALPDETIEFLESRRRIEIALNQVGSPCSGLLRYLFLENPPLDYREVAKKTGLAMGSIGPARLRCMQKLRRILKRRR